MKIDKAAAEEDFDNFLMIMYDQLDAFQYLASSKGINLDFSLDDLDRLETLFLLLTEHADKDTISSLIVTFARHLGEIVRINYGGKWVLPLEDERNINYNTPVIVGHSPIEGLEFAPLSVMRGFALRKQPGSLKRAINAQIDIKPLDLDDLLEE